ncbi:hypothetical protein FHR24_002031 [Wenyingzhuangia heitensis]|uniref:Uncharacterized protein n=1 Tax=Wenyingzhuangia heitensis TaxID=1487859 RepID=A0ABX0U9Z1_9FLAO|nr:hypothetical protein [Wenyingzhuangia heitensis]NIJ45563.1 hypothetical protein [Wenyingzhuangia heitensis]
MFEYITCYDYIVNELCVNKDKPELQCNGKCYLMKELSKTSESEKNKGDTTKKTVYEFPVLFCQTIENTRLPFPISGVILNVVYKNLYSYLISSSLFRPPNLKW